MESKEAVFKALKSGKVLTNSITRAKYKLFEGKLHILAEGCHTWEASDLSFFFPPSWLNLNE